MLNKTILAIALTLTFAAAASAATKQDRWMDSQNSAVASQTADDVLFDRAKGGIDY
jgi:hypothetical protein